jgi:hypothetical protein
MRVKPARRAAASASATDRRAREVLKNTSTGHSPVNQAPVLLDILREMPIGRERMLHETAP